MLNVSEMEDLRSVCLIDNVQSLLVRDLVDMAVFFLLPLAFLLAYIKRLDSRVDTFAQFKIFVPIVFVTFHMPVMLVSLTKNVRIFSHSDDTVGTLSSLWLDAAFTLAQLVYHLHSVVFVVCEIYFTRHSRQVFCELMPRSCCSKRNSDMNTFELMEVEHVALQKRQHETSDISDEELYTIKPTTKV